MIEARAVTRTFGAIRALDACSLAVAEGAFVAVTGKSGCGKTTLLSLLALLDRPDAGAVLFEGRDLARASGAERARTRRRFGLVFQHAHMVRSLPVWENVTYPLVPRGVTTAERRRVADEALARVGLGGRATALPEQLSGGERQRAGIARALAGQPDVLIADEPTSELDAETAADIVALFREFGGTVIVATHDPALVELASDTFRL